MDLQKCNRFMDLRSYTPAPPKVKWGILDSPQCLSVRLSVRPPVRPSVCRQGFRNFLKKTIGSIHFIPGIYPYGVSLDPYTFRVPSLIFGPLVAKYLAENGVSGTFWKKTIGSIISYLAFILMGWVSWPLYIFVFLALFLVLWWPNICRNGVSGTFWKFCSWRIPTCVAHECKIEIFIGYFWMRWVVIRAGVYCPHLWAQLVELWGYIIWIIDLHIWIMDLHNFSWIMDFHEWFMDLHIHSWFFTVRL